jgi:hypothetical protein
MPRSLSTVARDDQGTRRSPGCTEHIARGMFHFLFSAWHSLPWNVAPDGESGIPPAPRGVTDRECLTSPNSWEAMPGERGFPPHGVSRELGNEAFPRLSHHG